LIPVSSALSIYASTTHAYACDAADFTANCFDVLLLQWNYLLHDILRVHARTREQHRERITTIKTNSMTVHAFALFISN